MNILFYCSEYPPYLHGGIGSVLKIEAEELARRGHNVYVIGYYRYHKKMKISEVIEGVHIYRYSFGLFKKRIVNKLNYYANKFKLCNPIAQFEVNYIENKIEKLIKEKNIEIFECPDYLVSASTCCGVKYRRIKGCVSVVRLHGSASYLNQFSEQNFVTSYTKKNDETNYRRFDNVSAVSKYILNYVKGQFPTVLFSSEKCIYNPIENDFFKENEVSNGDTIFFGSKLSKLKGCFSLIKAFNLIARDYPHIKLNMVGVGDVDYARSLVDEDLRNRVFFLGFCDRETIKKEIDTCLFACTPSYCETFSIGALEIMARNRFLITTKETSGPEIIDDGVNGLLVNPCDPVDIADKIRWALENKKQCDDMSRKGYEKVKSLFAVNTIVEQMENYYKSLLFTQEN